MLIYLKQKFEDVFHLRPDVGAVFYVRPHCVHVVQRNQQDFTRLEAQRHLIFECHRHQVIQLRHKEEISSGIVPARPHQRFPAINKWRTPSSRVRWLQHSEICQQNDFCPLLFLQQTLSILALFSLMMDACANLSKTVLIAFFEYNSCGLKSSSMNLLLNIVPVMSCRTIMDRWLLHQNTPKNPGLERQRFGQKDVWPTPPHTPGRKEAHLLNSTPRPWFQPRWQKKLLHSQN